MTRDLTDVEAGKSSRASESPRQYPATFESADQLAAISQTNHAVIVIVDLSLLVLVSLASAVSAAPQPYGSTAKIVALVGAVLALVMFWAAPLRKHRNQWATRRSIAESVKSLTWQFAMAVPPFHSNLDAPEVRDLFVERIAAATEGAGEHVVASTNKRSEETREINDWTLSLRQRSEEGRLCDYLKYRIENQIDWYSTKSLAASKSAKLWRGLVVVAHILVVVTAVTAAAKMLPDWIDLTGFLATCAVAFFTWQETRQYEELATSYANTYRDLRVIQEKVRTRLEHEEAPAYSFLEDAVQYTEGVISHEHSMWRVANLGRLS